MKKSYKPKPRPQRRGGSALGIGLVAVGGLVLLAAIAFAFLGNGGGPGSNFTPEVKGAPRLKANRQKIDLGNIKLGQTVQASFDIVNVGDQTLRLTQAPFIEVVEGC
jgi:hypothetical protein